MLSGRALQLGPRVLQGRTLSLLEIPVADTHLARYTFLRSCRQSARGRLNGVAPSSASLLNYRTTRSPAAPIEGLSNHSNHTASDPWGTTIFTKGHQRIGHVGSHSVNLRNCEPVQVKLRGLGHHKIQAFFQGATSLQGAAQGELHTLQRIHSIAAERWLQQKRAMASQSDAASAPKGRYTFSLSASSG